MIKENFKTYMYKLITKINTKRAYPENAKFNTCASRTLKFHTSSDLHKTKKWWNFELDILTTLWVIGDQKYIDYIVKCWECT